MRNLWLILVVLAACKKDDAPTSKVVAHDAMPKPPDVDDTAPVEPYADGGDCKDEPACEAACTAKKSRACAALGELRKLTPTDACKLGDGVACIGSAMSVAGDEAKVAARATLTASCDAGDAVSCHELAGLERHGQLGPRDTTTAQVHDRKACDLGLAQGCFETFDPERALAIDLTACDRGDLEACAGAMTPAEQLGPDRLLRVRRRVEKVLDQACATDADACYLGTLVAAEPAAVSSWWLRADALWTKACEGGDRDACVELAAVLAPGEDATPPPQLDRHKDPFRGRKYWQKACELDPKDEAACTEAKR